MPGALGELLDAIQAGLGQIPPAMVVLALLFGPTLAYLGFRYFAGPRSSTPENVLDDLFWICPECKSANEVARRRCYLCQTDREAVAGALRVVDRDRVVEIDEAGPEESPLVAVGPGRAPPSETPSDPLVAATSSGTIVPIEEAAKRRKATRGKRPAAAIPVEPEQDDDDVVAASQTPARASRRRPRPPEEDAAG